MCGRFTIVTEQDYLEDRFGARFERAFQPVYNAAPSQSLPIITADRPQAIQYMYWGLRPVWWEKLAKKRDGLINVRDDNLKTKKTFATDWAKRRCLVLADGFFEWEKKATRKIPYRFILKNEAPFALAGIWEDNVDLESGEIISSFAIVTTVSNALVGRIHNRMPVILNKNEERVWLKLADPKKALNYLKPFPAGKMKMYEVSKLVNNPLNNNIQVIINK